MSLTCYFINLTFVNVFKKTLLLTILFLTLLGVSHIASATFVSDPYSNFPRISETGDLLYVDFDGDALSNKGTIVNTNTGELYLGWRELAGLTYAETLVQISAGYEYEGWRIATQADATYFYTSAGGKLEECFYLPSSLDDFCSNIEYSDGDFGKNEDHTIDNAFFLSDVAGNAGLIRVIDDRDDFFGYNFELSTNWADITYADTFKYDDGSGGEINPFISWLLVKGDAPLYTPTTNNPSNPPVTVQIPEPSILTLMSLGLLGIIGVSRRKIKH